MANTTGSYSDNFEETPYYEVRNAEADVLSVSNDYYPSSKLVKKV
ncbi:hypothetical protein NO1_0887 [Candidatus Termititenax aidoneus]|uniref:Uncharacterized protein n=1 Tax=Termititenax aidoneus TaxID=2218524 RepID=A0A388TA20_TERA1|nr:hypothetical protein NO1_0887 [Candidatus Termititenax aidoneus]